MAAISNAAIADKLLELAQFPDLKRFISREARSSERGPMRSQPIGITVTANAILTPTHEKHAAGVPIYFAEFFGQSVVEAEAPWSKFHLGMVPLNLVARCG